MPEYIQHGDLNRMFPYEFFNELHDNVTEYTSAMPHLLINRLQPDNKLSPYDKKMHFIRARHSLQNLKLNTKNIFDVQPFGEVLTLDVVYETKALKPFYNNLHKLDRNERTKMPLIQLLVQYYDSESLPVFSSSVTQESIAQIPEILWDDPRLFIGYIHYDSPSSSDDENTPDGPQVYIVKCPDDILDKFIEDRD